VHELGEGRYLILLWTGGRARRSGLELEGEIAHIVKLRDGRAERLDVYLGWDAARQAAGLG
jgi:ketosteroid isomerase-like protein